MFHSNCLSLNETPDKYVTYIYSFARSAFGQEGLLCRHNEPGSEQHAGPKRRVLWYFSDTITVCDFSLVHS